MNETNENLEFVREIKVESCDIELKFTQHSVGDVGCVVWDAGIALGKYLDHQQSLGNYLNNKLVIDIGSGTGVVGLFATALGAEVILTDLPEIIPILEKNIQSNQEFLKGTVSASILKWGEDVSLFPIPDVILVSDCIYYDMSVEKLVPTLAKLAGQNTKLLISYEDRVLGNKIEILKKFIAALKQFFDIETISATDQHPDYQSQDIHLLKCKKKSMDNAE